MKGYRFGYQGQFAEEDQETGWNSFELRMYDAVVGRWMAPDPMRQYFSPYLSMGNNPVSRVDPDGGFDDVNYNSKTGETTVHRTNDNFDRNFVDGKLVGYSGKGSWQFHSPDATVAPSRGHFLYDIFGSAWLDDNFFAAAMNMTKSVEDAKAVRMAHHYAYGQNYLKTVGVAVGLPVLATGIGEALPILASMPSLSSIGLQATMNVNYYVNYGASIVSSNLAPYLYGASSTGFVFTYRYLRNISQLQMQSFHKLVRPMLNIGSSRNYLDIFSPLMQKLGNHTFQPFYQHSLDKSIRE